MKKVFISLVVALVLVSLMAVPAMAAEIGKTASVSVPSYISVTLTDYGTAGLNWGSLNPGTTKEPEENAPAIKAEAGVENNGSSDIELSGTGFTDGGTNSFAIANAFWHTADVAGSATSMKENGASTDTVATLSAGQSVDLYHWISIPYEQAAADYTSTFTYEATTATQFGE